ncbi:MAG: T9SS-dependent M36 family metallopeptidase [Bacteroidia bacterium]|nr:T9SS-dependent M36 family metallopeptidase [Bacteroidia bacterium]
MTKVKLSLVVLFCIVLGSNVFGQNKPIGPVLQDFKTWGVSQGFSQADLQELKVTNDYVTQHNSVRHIYLQQAHNGISIVNSNASIHVWNGKVVARHQKLIKGLGQKSLGSTPVLSPEAALQSLCVAHDWKTSSQIEVLSVAKGLEQSGTLGSNQIAHEPIPFKLVYYADQKGGVKLGWNMQVQSTDGPHYYNAIIDANSGGLIFEEDWVVECNFEANHTHDADAHMNFFEESFMYAPRANSLEEANMMTGQYRVLAIPTESPNHGPYVLIQDPSDATASPFGWHDTDGVAGAEFTITRGNNVWASEDRDANNVPGYSPDGGANLDFDFTYDTSVGPDQNQDAVITNLFYMNNIMHDVWYNYGFDEVSGNFQVNNYGRGGTGGDAVRADAQDGSGTNNATFGTPPDGSSGVMSMFIWPSGDPGIGGVEVNSPASNQGAVTSRLAAFGDTDIINPVTADLILVEDGTGNNEGCNALSNAGDVSGKIVLIDRGTCEFGVKALNAQNAGAIGVIVANDGRGGGLISMAPGASGAGVNIPAFFISQNDGTNLKNLLASGTVNITLSKPLLAATDRDSDLDNGIVAHEFGHGISNRLTGGPAEAGCLGNEEQPGEGWSDWFALVMQVKPGDTGAEAKGIGTYAAGQATTGGGIRNFPYSTDMTVSPYTYNDIKTFSVPHGVGSVMCSMLWDLYWAMTDEHGFDADIYNGTGGNNMAMQLVLDGMKLQPCFPGFTQVRDAILLADSINYGGANQRLIWEVFARRGLGASADAGSSFSRSDGTEAFDLPDKVKEILFMEKTVDKNSVENGDTITFSFFVRNQKSTPLNNLIVRDTLSSDFQYVNNSSTINLNLSGNILSFNLGNFAPEQDTTFSFQVTANSSQPFSLPDFEDDIEGDVSDYRNQGRAGVDEWRTSIDRSSSPLTSWFIPNVDTTNDQALIMPIFTPTGSPVLSFWHYYDTEATWDGGVVEILSGGQWVDLGEKMLTNGYNSTVQSNNPMGARLAFSGKSNGWIQTKIDLTDFEGVPAALAFRFGSDDNTFEEGWYIDDILVQNEFISTNAATVTSDEGDVYRAEIARPVAIIITDIANSTRELPNEVEIRLYPNPAQEQVSLEYFGTSTEMLQVEFRNTIGQMVKGFEMRPFANQSSSKIDISNLPAGIYNISIRQGDMRTIKKLLVE